MLDSDNELAATAAAQLFAPRYEPVMLTEPEPMVSVPENTAVTAPVATGQLNRLAPAGNVIDGGAAGVAPPVFGN